MTGALLAYDGHAITLGLPLDDWNGGLLGTARAAVTADEASALLDWLQDVPGAGPSWTCTGLARLPCAPGLSDGLTVHRNFLGDAVITGGAYVQWSTPRLIAPGWVDDITLPLLCLLSAI